MHLTFSQVLCYTYEGQPSLRWLRTYLRVKMKAIQKNMQNKWVKLTILIFSADFFYYKQYVIDGIGTIKHLSWNQSCSAWSWCQTNNASVCLSRQINTNFAELFLQIVNFCSACQRTTIRIRNYSTQQTTVPQSCLMGNLENKRNIWLFVSLHS